MRAALTIAKREVHSYFVSPIAYVLLVAWVYITGLSFYLLVSWFAANPSSGGSNNPLSMFFGQTVLFWIPLLLFAPVMTMRLFAAERASNTLEPLMTAPVSEVSIVVGKYLAALVFWVVLWIPTLLYVWIVSRYGDIDLGVVAASYLGVFGVGLWYMAWGMLASALASNQVVAAVLGFFVLGAFFVLGIAEFVHYDVTREVLGYLSVWSHMEDFSKGVVDSRYLVFDVSMATLAVYLTVQVLSRRRVAG